MTSSVPSRNALPESPVFGASLFTGRTRLAHNLLSRCLRRQSILLYGGPKLGKTSMLLHLQWLVDQDRRTFSAMPAALYLDLSDEGARKQLLLGRWASPAPILLLDNCDHLVEGNYLDKLREFMNSDSLAHAIGRAPVHGTILCWTGNGLLIFGLRPLRSCFKAKRGNL
jgi:hypothetical protein